MRSATISKEHRLVAEDALDAAIKAMGTSKELASQLKLSPQAVSQWEIVPANRVLAVEALTGIHRSRLRPDFYPLEVIGA